MYVEFVFKSLISIMSAFKGLKHLLRFTGTNRNNKC